MSVEQPERASPSIVIPGVRAWSLMQCKIERDSHAQAPQAFDQADESLWSEVQRLNPRVHDGPILRVSRFDPAQASFACAVDSYKSLAIQQARQEKSLHEIWSRDPFAPSLIWMIGVKGWIVAKDRHAAEHLLIARRGPQTRIYGMMWESAPAGGVKPSACGPAVPAGLPATSSASVLSPLVSTLAEEAEEELGLSLDWSRAQLLGVAQDSIAMSYDVFYRIELPEIIDPRKAPVCQTGAHAWEYVDSAWLAKSDAAAFDRQSPDAIVPTVRAMMRVTNWVE